MSMNWKERAFPCLRKQVSGSLKEYNPVPPRIEVRRDEFIDDVEAPFLMMGSCFAGNVNRVLKEYGFRTHYDVHSSYHTNGASARSMVERVLAGRPLPEDGLHDFGGMITSPDYYFVCYEGASRRSLFENRTAGLDRALRAQLETCRFFIFTLGTADVMRAKRSGRVAMNSNKIPVSEFIQERQTVEEILGDLEAMRTAIRAVNPGLRRFIVTVSPQRYAFYHENETPFYTSFDSKMNLRMAAGIFAERHEDAVYFPSFEIVTEELRLLDTFAKFNYSHVSEETAEYVSERFLDLYTTDEMKSELKVMFNLRYLDTLIESRDYPEAHHAGRLLAAAAVREVEACTREHYAGRTVPERVGARLQAAYHRCVRTEDVLRCATEYGLKGLRPRYLAALALEQSGRPAEARSAFEQVAADAAGLDPAFAANAWFHVGEIEFSRGNIQPAVDAYRHCRELNPVHQRAGDCLKILEASR